MKIRDFGVEIWMNAYENHCQYNLAETCVQSLSVGELLDLSSRREAVLEELAATRLTYGDIEGSPRLRQAIAGLYQSIAPEQITVTNGAIGANALTMLALVEPGDQVISVLPTYQQHYSIPESIGAQVHILRLREETGWLPDPEELRGLVRAAGGRVKLININNPNNPTGSVMEEPLLRELVEIARSAGAWLLCDEVYRGLCHQGEAYTASVADLYEKGISTGSMSKTYSLAAAPGVGGRTGGALAAAKPPPGLPHHQRGAAGRPAGGHRPGVQGGHLRPEPGYLPGGGPPSGRVCGKPAPHLLCEAKGGHHRLPEIRPAAGKRPALPEAAGGNRGDAPSRLRPGCGRVPAHRLLQRPRHHRQGAGALPPVAPGAIT